MRVNDFARLASIGAVLRQFSVASRFGLDALVSRQLARRRRLRSELQANARFKMVAPFSSQSATGTIINHPNIEFT
jgi:hypothetical protein